MSVIATALEILMEHGVSGRDLVDAVARLEAAMGTSQAVEPMKQKTSAAIRQERYRRNKASREASQSVTTHNEVTEQRNGDVTGDVPPPPLSPPSPSPQTPKPQPPLTPAPAEDAHTRGLVKTGSVQRIFDAWNAMASTCRARGADKLTDKRKAQIQSRIKDYTEPVILETIGMVPAQQWLMGLNDRGWKADLEFFLRPDSITKIREGKYEHGTGIGIGPVGSYSRGTRPDPAVDMLRAAEEAARAAGDWQDDSGTGDQIPSWLYD